VVDVSPSRFEALVAEALDGIPAELASRMDNVAVVVRAHGGDPSLLGLYEGIPLTERIDYGAGAVLPDRGRGRRAGADHRGARGRPPLRHRRRAAA
jgi:predicted Zn-dependent protease with MMP-like domain